MHGAASPGVSLPALVQLKGTCEGSMHNSTAPALGGIGEHIQLPINSFVCSFNQRAQKQSFLLFFSPHHLRIN